MYNFVLSFTAEGGDLLPHLSLPVLFKSIVYCFINQGSLSGSLPFQQK